MPRNDITVRSAICSLVTTVIATGCLNQRHRMARRGDDDYLGGVGAGLRVGREHRGGRRDTLIGIDKRTLGPVASVREPGKTLAHIEVTKAGRYTLASLWEADAALIVYNARTFRELKRQPMNQPVGKYNVWSEIARSAGASR